MFKLKPEVTLKATFWRSSLSHRYQNTSGIENPVSVNRVVSFGSQEKRLLLWHRDQAKPKNQTSLSFYSQGKPETNLKR